ASTPASRTDMCNSSQTRSAGTPGCSCSPPTTARSPTTTIEVSPRSFQCAPDRAYEKLGCSIRNNRFSGGTMTKRRLVILATLIVLALSAWAAWSALHRGEAADIQRLADRVTKKNDRALKEEGEALAKKYKNLGQLMNLFKKRTPQGGGLGVGKESG